MKQSLTIFDLDETLIAGDSALIWSEFLVQEGVITDPKFLQEDRRLMNLYALGELDMQAYLSFAMAPIRHLSTVEVDRLAALCVEQQILPRLYPQAQSLLTKLYEEKICTLIISATVSFIVKKVAERLAIKNALGIDLVVEDGCYTSKIKGTATYRSGKVIRLNEWLMLQNRSFSPLEFYTDSINDLPLCLHVDNPIMVNPCRQLIQQAQLYNWPVLSW
ncbi:HAD family hydrolase [Psychromonas antarctica]|uniref:HAD family hydrolase n=1 Tax=Psychromonas antarctica TaxID=67573 RepID=UPI001EE99D83|nr:HAD family hydrolase [Psychromonas antarctica]MCG6201828.1 HAD-IB family hydrolase [Psychromonas antarctica]